MARRRAALPARTWSAPKSSSTTKKANSSGRSSLRAVPIKACLPSPISPRTNSPTSPSILHMQVELVANRGTYKRLNVVTGDAKAGEAYFNGAGGCKNCHSPTGDLAHIGARYQPDQLQTRFVWPGGGGCGAGGAAAPRKLPSPCPRARPSPAPCAAMDDFDISILRCQGQLPLLAARHRQGAAGRPPGRPPRAPRQVYRRRHAQPHCLSGDPEMKRHPALLIPTLAAGPAAPRRASTRSYSSSRPPTPGPPTTAIIPASASARSTRSTPPISTTSHWPGSTASPTSVRSAASAIPTSNPPR